MSTIKYLNIINSVKRFSSSNSCKLNITPNSYSISKSSNISLSPSPLSSSNKRYFCTNQQLHSSKVIVKDDNHSDKRKEEKDNDKYDDIEKEKEKEKESKPEMKKPKAQCWCLINCKLQSKRIHVSKVKPLPYENEKGYVLGEYNVNYDSPCCQSRKQVLDMLVKEKDQSIQEQLESQRSDEEKEKEEEKKQTKNLFKTEEEKEEDDRIYPVLNDTTTSIGPCHVLYKNEWIVTVVERTETDNKDNEPYFVLKLKTPIRLKSDLSFNIESLSYFSSIERLLSFAKSVDCSDKEFEKLFLTKSDSKLTKQETKWLVEKRPYLREALMSLKLHLLPSVGFNNCGINLELQKEDRVKCKQDSSLEFPDGVYQLSLEIDSTESIWKKSPEAIEKVLYLYTVMFDSIASTNYIDDAPIDQVYL